MEVSGQLHAVAALPQGKESQHLFSMRLGGHQRLSGCFVEERKSLIPAGNQTINPHSSRLFPSHILSTLCQLHSVSVSAWLGECILLISAVILTGF
jgi:hypothetical protein